MKLLAIETATEACSVALWSDGEVRERFEIAPRRHAELVLPWCDALLAEAGVSRAQLDAIAVGRGPGAFTGVRLAIAVAQGIALGLGRPLVAMSTLQVLAAGANARDGDRVLAAIDARMHEVYWASYCIRDGIPQETSPEAVVAPAAIDVEGDGWHGIGTGFSAGDSELAKRLKQQFVAIDAAALPHAADLSRLAATAFARGEIVSPDLVEPAYLRNNVALTLVEQQAARVRKETTR
ncbi:tRNA (adenosine(37)-N6)-threonylcarbamoyltransferase complex dimerization subunit type 1 TsaB [Solilutibacter silvestris]|uniref:tRNA threonylcarbamoyladenosine biosynthesis protein TsaB n=1 Tax=Solilutibacter silvestris TaxID=1645665 RepID=A0A2K1PXG1_9GAMM|nr:tRNA (adenosine(37)-N6)-threonylcarbamoyltransferase complex dimerization subunit type 1 TsaB [Lysobacter silvestris]PNS07475.1 YeaZ protein [Lysobacter silvestris]